MSTNNYEGFMKLCINKCIDKCIASDIETNLINERMFKLNKDYEQIRNNNTTINNTIIKTKGKQQNFKKYTNKDKVINYNDKICDDEHCNDTHCEDHVHINNNCDKHSNDTHCNDIIKNVIIPFEKSFASCKGHLLWSTKNETLPINHFKYSQKKCYFDCKCGHTFHSKLQQVANGRGCPYCCNQKLCDDKNCIRCSENSFELHPYAALWSDKNEYPPRKYFKTSKEKFYFNCNKCNHEFMTCLGSIAVGHGCPYCSNQKLCDDGNCDPCFARSFASYEKSKFFSNKNDFTPRQIGRSSMKMCIFDCSNCNEEYISNPNNVSKGYWCKCSRKNKSSKYPNKKILAIDNKKEKKEIPVINNKNNIPFEKSFATTTLSALWSTKNEKLPTDYTKYSKTICYFECDKCNHTFKKSLQNVSNGQGCQYCSNASCLLCEDKNCNDCFIKSFASVTNSKYWSNKNEKSPRDYFKFSDFKAFFDCDCGHTFNSPISTISYDMWCPYCASKTLCGDIGCKTCFDKSFATHSKSEFFSNKNILKPHQIFKSANQKVIFDCPYCKNEYFCAPCVVSKGHWCNCIRTKTEKLLLGYLKQTYNDIVVEHQKSFEWCRNVHKLPFDFCIEEYKLIIESDGDQHITQVSTWTPPEEIQKRDVHKMNCAKQHGYSIIRIFQRDVWDDKNNWKENLHNAIITIKNSKERKDIFIGDVYKTVEQYNAYLTQ